MKAMSRFSGTRAGRIFLHLVCLARRGRVHWHLQGIAREFSR